MRPLPAEQRTPSPFRRTLVPVDFSPRSFAALGYAVGLARETGAAIEVLHVLPGVNGARRLASELLGVELPRLPPEALAAARADLDALVRSVAHDGVALRDRLVAGDPAACIVQIAIEEAHDLIVIATHGRTGLDHFLLGSVTEQVIARAPCPVLTLRDGTPAAPGPRHGYAQG